MTGRSPRTPRQRAEPVDAKARVSTLIGDRAVVRHVDGYLDVLGDDGVPRSGPQLAMQSRLLPMIYERLWRPVLFGAASFGLREEGEAALMRRYLGLRRGDSVLDVACGPGNTLRRLVQEVGPAGFAVGVDAAPAMLERAVRDTPDENVAYVRADGAALPFPDASFDAVSCFGALYLVDRPFDVLRELIRVLAPGGRLAILTSCHRAPGPLRPLVNLACAGTGFRWFDPDEITAPLERHGFEGVQREIRGLMQFVGARSPQARS